MSTKQEYNQIRLKNIKKAKLRQKETELELAEKYNNIDAIPKLEHEIEKLKKEIQ